MVIGRGGAMRHARGVRTPSIDLSALSAYPGRGIVLRRPAAGELEWLYFLTGRSDASKARRFALRDGSLTVAPLDPGTDHDDLRHYPCVTTVAAGGGDRLVIGNGDHVAQLAHALAGGAALVDAVAPIEPEPDALHTPRIAAVVSADDVWIAAVLRSAGATERRVEQIHLTPGGALVLHTYAGSIDEPIGTAPTFRFGLRADEPLPDLVWDALHPDHRVALATGTLAGPEPTRVLPAP